MIEDAQVLNLLRTIALASQKSSSTLEVRRQVVSSFLRSFLSQSFDSEWYLEANADVEAAVRKGEIESAFDHWVNVGVFEGRMPCPIELDEADYERRHSDVANSLKTGSWKTASAHFHSIGFMEGREFKLV